MGMAYYTSLKAHPDNEFHQELSRVASGNMEMISKHKAFTDNLHAAIGSPRGLFKEVNTMRNNFAGSFGGPFTPQEISFHPKAVHEIRDAIKNLFNSFSSIDNCVETIERLRRDARRAQTWCGASTEALAELALAYKANTVAACYLETYTVRTLLPEAHEAREASHTKQLTAEKEKLAEMEKNEAKAKDKKEAKAQIEKTKAKIANLEGSYPALTDGECTLSRLQDGSFRLILREGDHTAIDAEGS